MFLKWTEVSGAGWYEILGTYQSTSNPVETEWIWIGFTSQLSFQLEGEATLVRARVRATASGGDVGGWSAGKIVNCEELTAPQVTLECRRPRGTGQILVAGWSASGGSAVATPVQWRIDGPDEMREGTGAAGSSLEVVSLDIEPDGYARDYRLTVWATLNGIAVGDPGIATVSCDGDQVTPTNLIVECAVPLGGTAPLVEVSWDAPADITVGSYEVEGDLTYTGASTSFSDTGAFLTEYEVRARAYDSTGSQWLYWTNYESDACPIADPVDVVVSCVSGEIVATWTDPAPNPDTQFLVTAAITEPGSSVDNVAETVTAAEFRKTGTWQDGTTVEFQVQAEHDGEYSAQASAPDTACINTVAGLDVECAVNGGNVEVTMEWDALTGMTSYEVEGDLTYNGASTSFTAPGVHGESYTVRVRATDGTTTSEWSESDTADCPPAVPSTFDVSCSADGTLLTVSWDSDSSVASFEAAEDGGDLAAFSGSGNSFTRTSTPGVEYRWHVKALGNNGAESAWTGWVAETCPFTAPTGLDVDCSADGLTVTVSWDSDSRATSYEAVEDGADLAGYAGAATSFTRTSTSGDSYSWQVRSISSGGSESDWTAWTDGDCAVTPPTPANVAMTCTGPPTGSQTLSVTWDPPPGSPSYDIWYNYDGSISNLGTLPVNRTRSNAVVVNLPAPTGQVGRLYEVQVQAESIAGASAWSQNTGVHDPSAWVRCPGIPPALADADVEATCYYTALYIEAEWEDVDDKALGDTYTWEAQSTDTGTWVVSGTTATFSVADWNTPVGFGIQVRATNAHGSAPWAPAAGIDLNCRLIGK